MLRFTCVTTLLSILLPGIILSQPTAKDVSFFVVDSFSRTVRYKHDIYRLTKELTDGYSEQLPRARAIFIWITDNIGYDYKFINKGREIKVPECESGEYCEQIHEEWEKKYLKRVLRRKTAICDGYARLFKKMCEIAGIRCEIVTGYTKTKPYQIGNTGSVNHAWNVLFIDSACYFVDPTWAAGGCPEDEETGKLLPFQRQYDEYYWLTPFDEFFRNHYPQDTRWVLNPNYTKEKYAANPYYASDIIRDIHLLSPASGIIKAAKGDTLHFKFEYNLKINLLQINSNVFRNPAVGQWEKRPWHRKVWKTDTLALKRQQYIQFKRNGALYEFDYVVTDSSLYYVELLFDRRKVMRFNVIIDPREQ